MNKSAVRTIRTILTLLPALAFLASGAYAAQVGYKGYPRGNALITVQELKGLIDTRDPKLVIVAAQSNLEYLPGRIPGAQQVDRPAYAAPLKPNPVSMETSSTRPGSPDCPDPLGSTGVPRW